MSQETKTAATDAGPVDRQVRPDPVGWVVMWPAAGGGRKPIYSHGETRPSYGKELDALLTQFPVYAAPANADACCDAGVAAERERAEMLRQALLKCKTCALSTEVRDLVNAALRA